MWSDLCQCQRHRGCEICHLCPCARLGNMACPLSPGFPLTNMLRRLALPARCFKIFAKKLRKRSPQPVILTQVHCCPCLALHWCDINTSAGAKRARKHCTSLRSRIHEISAANTWWVCCIYCPIWQIFCCGNNSIPSVVSDLVKQSNLTGLAILITFLRKFLCSMYK